MRLTLAALATLLATPALAHEGHHETLTLVEQARHLLTQPDHLLAAAAASSPTTSTMAPWAT